MIHNFRWIIGSAIIRAPFCRVLYMCQHKLFVIVTSVLIDNICNLGQQRKLAEEANKEIDRSQEL